jgi:hypothetical protein
MEATVAIGVTAAWTMLFVTMACSRFAGEEF